MYVNTANWDIQPSGQMALGWKSFRVTDWWLIVEGSHLLVMKLLSSTFSRASPTIVYSILIKVYRLGVLYAIYGAQCMFCCITKHLVNYFLSLSFANQVSPPLMCSLLDQVPEPKETQPGSIQPYSAGPAEQSVPEPVVEVSCILMSWLVFTLCGTLLQLDTSSLHTVYAYGTVQQRELSEHFHPSRKVRI